MIRRNCPSRIRRDFGVRLAVLLGLAALLLAAQPLAAQDCSFQLGFKALHDLIPAVVGECLENEHHNPETGLTQQATSNGLLTWRKADNWTGFSDGRHTWVRGPAGVRQWANDEHFPQGAPDSDRSSRRITLDQLLNAQYRLPLLGGEDTPIRLENGEASICIRAGAGHSGIRGRHRRDRRFRGSQFRRVHRCRGRGFYLRRRERDVHASSRLPRSRR